MFMMTAGVSFIHAASFTFSGASVTLATSDSSTGAPLRYFTTIGRYWALDRSWSLAPMV
jgi:hypothetical protein